MVYVITYTNPEGIRDVWKYGVTGYQKRPESQLSQAGPSASWSVVDFYRTRREALIVEYLMTGAYYLNNGELPRGMKRPSDFSDLLDDLYK